jgi:hypothetical protein
MRLALARLLMRLVADYFAHAARPGASAHLAARRRPVVDYFAYVTHPGASTRRAARRRLLGLCRASGCLGV